MRASRRRIKVVACLRALMLSAVVLLLATPVPGRAANTTAAEAAEATAPGASLPTDLAVLPEGEARPLVAAHCGACHSLALVAQYRSEREGWLAVIRWMQETQGLWPLGELEPAILDYLSEHFAPIATGRRAPLSEALRPAWGH